MRAIKKGVLLTLGLVQFPVDVYSAAKSTTGVELTTVCNQGHTPTPVKQTVACPDCKSTDGFAKARRDGGGKNAAYTVLTETQVTMLAAPEAARTSMVVSVHEAADVEANTLDAGSVYYLGPPPGAGLYNVLRQVVATRTDKAFVCEWAARSNVNLYRLVVLDDRLAIRTLVRPDARQEIPAGTEDLAKHDDLVKALEQVVDTSMSAWTPDAHRDDRITLLASFTGTPGVPPPPAAAPADDTSDALLAALQASVKAAS